MSAWLLDRDDAITEFEDTGCEVSLSCLNCPLPQCKHDDPLWYRRYQRQIKDRIVLVEMQSENLTVEETAERFSMTVRTIFRIMHRYREAIRLGIELAT